MSRACLDWSLSPGIDRWRGVTTSNEVENFFYKRTTPISSRNSTLLFLLICFPLFSFLCKKYNRKAFTKKKTPHESLELSASVSSLFLLCLVNFRVLRFLGLGTCMGHVPLQDMHGWFSFVHCVCAEGGEGVCGFLFVRGKFCRAFAHRPTPLFLVFLGPFKGQYLLPFGVYNLVYIKWG